MASDMSRARTLGWLAVGIGLAAYADVLGRAMRGLRRLERERPLTEPTNWPSVTVVVPARDEAATLPALLADLAAQDYPGRWHLIVADDGSTDGTADVVRAAADPRFEVVTLPETGLASGHKKRAIAAAIGRGSGEIIATTDADCRVGPGWLRALVQPMAVDPTVGIVSGPVLFPPDGAPFVGVTQLFARWQALEFLGLVTLGAGTLAAGRPTTANGASLAYRRAAFEQVGGFAGLDHLASGDDELLLHRICRDGRWQPLFQPDPAARATTNAVATLADFFNQRRRWASKGLHYADRGLVARLVAIYGLHVALAVGLPVGAGWAWTGAAGKLLLDGAVLGRGARIIWRKPLPWRWLPVAEAVSLPYILFSAAAGSLGPFSWKGRTLRR